MKYLFSLQLDCFPKYHLLTMKQCMYQGQQNNAHNAEDDENEDNMEDNIDKRKNCESDCVGEYGLL